MLEVLKEVNPRKAASARPIGVPGKVLKTHNNELSCFHYHFQFIRHLSRCLLFSEISCNYPCPQETIFEQPVSLQTCGPEPRTWRDWCLNIFQASFPPSLGLHQFAFKENRSTDAISITLHTVLNYTASKQLQLHQDASHGLFFYFTPLSLTMNLGTPLQLAVKLKTFSSTVFSLSHLQFQSAQVHYRAMY